MTSTRWKPQSARSEKDETSHREGSSEQNETQRAEQETEQGPSDTYARRVMPASQNSTRLSTAKEIALAFGGSGAASASGWHDFRCPAHDDKTASCGVKDERDGKIAVKCHAGCERDAILDAIEAKGSHCSAAE